jgi:hypothetical protein
MNYLLLKAQRLAAIQTELLVLQKAAQYAVFWIPVQSRKMIDV